MVRGWQADAACSYLDPHVEAGFGDHTASIWEPNEPSAKVRTYSHAQLLFESARLANVLKSLRVRKGDRVCIYLQMIPELVVTCLACARIGAVHSVVSAAFSAEAPKDRLPAGLRSQSLDYPGHRRPRRKEKPSYEGESR